MSRSLGAWLLAGAAAESVMNAAKHGQVEQVSVYVDADSDPVQVFVRDRGIGFDPRSVSGDRRGLSESVVARTQRHGGSVEIVSTLGSGTEVRLSMPVLTDSGGATR